MGADEETESQKASHIWASLSGTSDPVIVDKVRQVMFL